MQTDAIFAVGMPKRDRVASHKVEVYSESSDGPLSIPTMTDERSNNPEQEMFYQFTLSRETWPVEEPLKLFEKRAGNMELRVFALCDGSLMLQVLRRRRTENYETDILVPRGGFLISVDIFYEPLNPVVIINGTQAGVSLMPRAHFDGKSEGTHQFVVPPGRTFRFKTVHYMTPMAAYQPSRVPDFPRGVPDTANSGETIFLRTIFDLANASVSDDWYVLLKSSALLRLLLLDGLIHKANQQHRLKLRYRVRIRGKRRFTYASEIGKPGIAPYPTDSAEELSELNETELLKLPAFGVLGEEISIKELIKAAANADGGVHFEPAKFPKEALALDYDEVCTAFGQANSRWVLKQLCYIVVTGLLPLVEAIQSRDAPG